MKKVFAVVIAALLALSLVACDSEESSKSSVTSSLESSTESSSSESIESESSEEESSEESQPEESGAEEDHVVDCATLEEANEAAGFSLTLPETWNVEENCAIQAVEGKLISVSYQQEDESEICVRKGLTDEDVVVDDATYEKEETVEVNELSVTLYGDGERVNLAVWKTDEYVYSLSFSAGVENSEATELVAAIQ